MDRYCSAICLEHLISKGLPKELLTEYKQYSIVSASEWSKPHPYTIRWFDVKDTPYEMLNIIGKLEVEREIDIYHIIQMNIYNANGTFNTITYFMYYDTNQLLKPQLDRLKLGKALALKYTEDSLELFNTEIEYKVENNVVKVIGEKEYVSVGS